MKRLVSAGVGALATFAVVGSALAADLPRRPAPAPVAKAPIYAPYNWTGLYVGLNGGYGWGTSSFSGATGTGDFNVNGGLLGGTLGYNWQVGHAVFGLETDLGWSGMKDSAACGAFTCETKNTWLGTTRGRIGYAWDRFMPYITGGVAYGNVKATTLGVGSASDTRFGWTVGAGVEVAVSGPWTAKLEYLYADLGDFNCGTCTATPPSNVDFTTNIVRAGLNYRF
ncbi:MAG: outer membrane protein [Pseudolabrys sp.]